MNDVSYLDKLTNFSSGKQEEKNQHRGLEKGKATERDRLRKPSAATLQSSSPQRPTHCCSCLARAHGGKNRWGQSPQRGIRDLPLSSLLVLEAGFLPCFVFLPPSPYNLPRVGVQWMNYQAKSPLASRPTSTSAYCKTCSEVSEIILDAANWSLSHPLTDKGARRPPELAR